MKECECGSFKVSDIDIRCAKCGGRLKNVSQPLTLQEKYKHSYFHKDMQPLKKIERFDVGIQKIVGIQQLIDILITPMGDKINELISAYNKEE